MFALWYLSLALDEFRKRLGWTSIFDIFKINKGAANNAIENKPEPSKSSQEPKPAIPEPANPVPAVQPEAKPTPPQKPADQPAPVPKPEPPKRKVAPAPPTPAPAPVPEPVVAPAPTPASNGPAISDAESLDRKIFGASTAVENGETKPTANVKAATSSFLAGEGQSSTLKQPKNLALRYDAVQSMPLPDGKHA